jgi:hypothetical protein
VPIGASRQRILCIRMGIGNTHAASNPSFLKSDWLILTTEQVAESLKQNGINRQMDIAHVPYAVTDEQDNQWRGWFLRAILGTTGKRSDMAETNPLSLFVLKRFGNQGGLHRHLDLAPLLRHKVAKSAVSECLAT